MWWKLQASCQTGVKYTISGRWQGIVGAALGSPAWKEANAATRRERANANRAAATRRKRSGGMLEVRTASVKQAAGG